MWTDIDRPRPRVRLTSILTYRLKQTSCPSQILIHQLKVNYNYSVRTTTVDSWQARQAECLPHHCIDKPPINKRPIKKTSNQQISDQQTPNLQTSM
jgi:hypothetical protein